MIRANFHTHTKYCDGSDNIEELILSAVEKGFFALGFSGHGYTCFDESYAMSRQYTQKYLDEIALFKQKYSGKIEILAGIEQDFYSGLPDRKFDFIIGSVHYIEKNGRFYPIDESKRDTDRLINEAYKGDTDALFLDYFLNVSKVAEKTGADIIGHFDLISKYLPDELTNSKNYLIAAKKAVERLIPFGKPFEINTGAVSRGVKKEPYPSAEILKVIKDLGGKIIFSSDCHDKKYLDFGFDAAALLAKDCGFSEYQIITSEGLRSLPL